MEQEVRRLEREVSLRFYLFAASGLLYLPIVGGPLFRAVGYEVYYLVAPSLLQLTATALTAIAVIVTVWSAVRSPSRLVLSLGGLTLLCYLGALGQWLEPSFLFMAGATLSVAAGLVHLLQAARQEARLGREQ